MKLDLFIQRVLNYDKTGEDTDILQMMEVIEKIGKELGIEDQSMITKEIINRDLKAVQYIKSLSTDDLGVELLDEDGKLDEELFLKNQLEQLIEYSNTDREIHKPAGDEGRLYSQINLQRIVGLLDFFFSLAEISPRALDLVAPALFPKSLQYLIELSVEGMPQVQILC